MPKQIDPNASLSESKLENVFTRAALKAHGQTRDLVAVTDTWSAPFTALQGQMELNEIERVELDAEFKILNAAFDAACIEFSEDVLKAVGKDRTDPRYTRYFAVAPSVFVKQDIDEQIKAVQGWLTVQDPVLDPWRARFEAHLTLLKDHRVRRQASQQKTISLQIARQEAATALTGQRDALHRDLGSRAQALNLGRGFADLFFRQG